MRIAWPHYMQGSSRLWLELIDASLEPGADQQPFATRLQSYRQAHQAVSDIWAREAGHALLHHLNALFGYQPLDMRF